jgi:hypothetical protein
MGAGSAALDGAASLWRSSLRSFIIVGLSAVVPLVLLSLVFGYRASTQQRQAAEFQVSMRIDGAAHRLDSILAAQSAAAMGVSGFRSVALGDYPHLYEHLQLMPGRHPEWSNIILAADTGERILDLRSPYGRQLPPVDLFGLPDGDGGGRRHRPGRRLRQGTFDPALCADGGQGWRTPDHGDRPRSQADGNGSGGSRLAR